MDSDRQTQEIMSKMKFEMCEYAGKYQPNIGRVCKNDRCPYGNLRTEDGYCTQEGLVSKAQLDNEEN